MIGGVPPAEVLQLRAELRARAREFFARRGILEVETPILGDGLIVETHIDPVSCRVHGPGGGRDAFLLASPEAPMKRLLASGAGPIYQFGPAFRDGEVGRRHGIEFTLLEWYRPGFDHHQLMDEVEELVQQWLPDRADDSFRRTSYRELFERSVGLDPLRASTTDVLAACRARGVPIPTNVHSVDDALDLLLVGALERDLGVSTPEFLYDYPASQAALARVREGVDGTLLGSRFELYIDGVELANGYHELVDGEEQRLRFAAANRQRLALGRSALPLDRAFLEAMDDGLPDCAGVALGFDRLVMIAAGCASITEVRVQPGGVESSQPDG